MKQGIQKLKKLVPVMVLLIFGVAQSSCAQNNYPDNDNNPYSNNDNNSNYDNSDQALISPDQDVNYDDFYNGLSPYGNWMNYPGYGNVWVCNVAGFRPYYSGGHWAYTRFGWTWVSDYNWGWAPFHYGRWSFDNAYGWFWVPGYTWGPAWVSWRNGGDYYGWSPLAPGLSVGVNVGFGMPAANWVFIPHRYMGFRNINNYYVSQHQNVNIIRNTTIINNTNVISNNRYVVGPQRTEVERYTGQRVQQQNIVVTNQRNNLGQDRNGAIHMFHPSLNNTNRGVNGINQQPNRQPNTAPQDNVRQQPFNNRPQPMQNGMQQPQRTEQQMPMQRLQQNGINNNNENNRFQNNGQTNVDQQRQQQMMQQRQQMMNERSEQIQQQQINQRQQQMEAQRNQIMQQRNQQMQEQRQQDMQRQQMQQQRQQQQFQQRQPQIQQRQNNNAPRSGENNNGRRE